jgi:acyl-CoA thioester hydrolase
MSFTYVRKLNYYETDKMGVVHHSNYIRFLEEARSRWLEELGISMEFLESNGYTIPTLEVNCKYKHHVTSGDTIIIKPKITEFNGVRMTVSYEVTEQKSGKVVIEAWTKHCFTNRELRPINMKKKDETVNKIFEDLLNEGRS